MCRVVEVYPDTAGVVRNVLVMAASPSSIDGSPTYQKHAAKVYLKRHVSNLIVIVPNENDIIFMAKPGHEDGGHGEVGDLRHGGECQIDDGADPSSGNSTVQYPVSTHTAAASHAEPTIKSI